MIVKGQLPLEGCSEIGGRGKCGSRMLNYAQVSMLPHQYMPTSLHGELADRNCRVKKELEDEKILSPLSLLLRPLRL